MGVTVEVRFEKARSQRHPHSWWARGDQYYYISAESDAISVTILTRFSQRSQRATTALHPPLPGSLEKPDLEYFTAGRA